LQQAASQRFDFIAIPLAADGGQGAGIAFRPSIESDRVLQAKTWNSAVVGTVSEILKPDAVEEANCCDYHCAALETELRWAAHLGLKGVLLPTPTKIDGYRYARVVNELLLAGIAESENDHSPLSLRVSASTDGWLAWSRFRMLCDHHPRLHVALEFTSDLVSSERELQRWLAEPVGYVVLHTDCFISNKHGHPVLPKKYKALLLSLFRRQVQIILFAPGSHKAGNDDADVIGPRLTYIAGLFQSLPALTQVEQFSKSHLDCLQAPLQPLKDNLESQTYELFESDPVKYAQYEEAVLSFLCERVQAGRAGPHIIMVLGAGRGPLVAASLRAAKRANAQVNIWAVEKNVNAVHGLRHRQRSEPDWSCVEVVAEDMRLWKAPQKADVMVSELLGSFGDNELSPECLDGAQRFLADDGVCIPQAYMSSLAPVSAPVLWGDARGNGNDSAQSSLETGYVVCLHKVFHPATMVKDCFAFQHPNNSLLSNDRYAELEFQVDVDCVVHGFTGYFDCKLYDNVRISIHPENQSDGMFSWFPMFFPLQVPLHLRKGTTIRSHWWRRHDMRKVWYEWALSEPVPTPIQNPGGRSWAMEL